MKGGYVYALSIEGTALVKIGRAQNVEQRLQARNTLPLEHALEGRGNA